MNDCQCIVGCKCVGMPNRFRKVLDAKSFWENSGDYQNKTVACDKAIAAEYGTKCESAWCQSMEPMVICNEKA